MLNIKQRQMNLRFLGYYGGAIDGIEGNGTISAYEQFQKAYSLKVDGIYGNNTNNKLIEVIKQKQTELGVPADGIAGPQTVNARDSQGVTWGDIQYFEKHEFKCPCGCNTNNINLKLVKILDDIRRDIGCALIISSGTRCSKHNAEVGGVPNSRHISGKAADVIASKGSKDRLLKMCQQYVNSGKARYTYTNNKNMGNAVHIDIQ